MVAQLQEIWIYAAVNKILWYTWSTLQDDIVFLSFYSLLVWRKLIIWKSKRLLEVWRSESGSEPPWAFPPWICHMYTSLVDLREGSGPSLMAWRFQFFLNDFAETTRKDVPYITNKIWLLNITQCAIRSSLQLQLFYSTSSPCCRVFLYKMVLIVLFYFFAGAKEVHKVQYINPVFRTTQK